MIHFLIAMLIAHYIADFPLQALFHDRMGQKHKKISHLLFHASMYGIWLTILMGLFMGFPAPILPYAIWGLSNAVLHGCVDYWTSRASNPLFFKGVEIVKCKPNDVCWGENRTLKFHQKYIGSFWCVIGGDQMLHMICLVITAGMLGLI